MVSDELDAMMLRANDRRRATSLLPAALLLVVACVPLPDAPVITAPVPPGDVNVNAAASSNTVFEQTSVTLSADPTGGTPPYLFRWDVNTAPDELPLPDETSREFDTGPLTAPGRFVFRVVVTDAAGFHATDFVAVEVLETVTASAPPLAVIGEPVELNAGVASEDVGLAWTVTRGDADFDDPASATPNLTARGAGTVEVLLTATPRSAGAAPTTRSFEIAAVPDLSPEVLIETNLGAITLRLEGEAAPLHTANFLLYVDDGFYDGLLFHRVACTDDPLTGQCVPFVLQGGGFQRIGGELVEKEATRDPVMSEAGNGLTNATVNSVALALLGGDPNSGTTQFFVNLDDNGFLDAQGFTVFASVVDGFDVLDAITAVETAANPFLGGEVSLPVEDVIMERVTRVAPPTDTGG